MDVTQELRDTENALRDFIAAELVRVHGADWVKHCGVTKERLEKWQERKDAEGGRWVSNLDERLIYYADFYDLRTILKKHWSSTFTEVFGNRRTMDVYLSEIEHLRNPDAHRRELLPYQKHLVLGICGEIRSRIARFRSRRETAADCFPRIESARDSLGNFWTVENRSIYKQALRKDTMLLRPRDRVEYVITASDPLGEQLEYAVAPGGQLPYVFSENNSAAIEIQDGWVGKDFRVALTVRSRRAFRAHDLYDDEVVFFYTVLPPTR